MIEKPRSAVPFPPRSTNGIGERPTVESRSNSALRTFALAVYLASLIALPGYSSRAQSFEVASVVPLQHAITARSFDPVAVTFTRDLDISTVTPQSFTVHGSTIGRYNGSTHYEPGSRTLYFVGDLPFRDGDRVTVTASSSLRSVDGQAMERPFQWQFTVRGEYGSGGFGPPNILELSGRKGPRSIYAGDLDGDGLLDLAVANGVSGTITILLNSGQSIPFRVASAEIATGPGTWQIAGGDWNGDSLLDLAVTNVLDNTVTILLNGGDLEFTASSVATGIRPLASVPLDFDGDGVLDIAVVAVGSNEIVLHRNSGGGVFDAPISVPTGEAPVSLVAVDIDNDGRLDLAVSSAGDRRVEIYRNDDGTFRHSTSISVGFSPGALVANDIFGNTSGRQGDGWVDFAVIAMDRNHVTVLQHPGNSNLVGFRSFSFTASDVEARGIVLADIDTTDSQRGAGTKDYDLDILTTHYASNELRILTNRAGTSLTASPPSLTTAPFVYPAGLAPLGIATGDFDNDGDQDVAVTNETTDQVRVFLNVGGDPNLARECLAVRPAPVAFGSVHLCESRRLTLHMENRCAVPISMQSITTTLAAFSVDFTPFTLAPQAKDSIEISFAPLSAQTYEGELRLQHEFAGKSAILPVPLTGSGARALLTGIPDVVTFSDVTVGESTTESLVLRNEGNVAIRIDSIRISDPSYTTAPLPPMTINAGSTQNLTVRFAPATATSRTASMILYTNDPCDPIRRMTLTGSGLLDLAVRFVSPLNSVTLNHEAVLTGLVENRSAVTVDQPFRLVMLHNDVALPDTTIIALGAKESVTFSRTISFPVLGQDEITFIADPDDAIAESDETNNVAVATINVQRGTQVHVRPNPFTPNADGFNDRVDFNIGELGLEAPLLKVFTMEGRLIRTDTEQFGSSLRWEGVDDAGQEQRPGLYLYLIQDGVNVITSGHITLAR